MKALDHVWNHVQKKEKKTVHLKNSRLENMDTENY